MNNLTELANQVLADAEKAKDIPTTCNHVGCSVCDSAKETKRVFMRTAANSAELLAKAVIIQQDLINEAAAHILKASAVLRIGRKAIALKL